MDTIIDILITSAGFLIFALVHSLTARYNFKERLVGRFSFLNRWYRLFYNTVSVITLGAWFHYAPFPEGTLYTLSFPWNLLFRFVQLLGVIGFVVSLTQVGDSDITGLKQLNNPERYGELSNQEDPELSTEGLYGWVRHPLYTTSVMTLAFNPVMTNFLALVTVLFGLYFWIGSYYEERALLRKFGDSYREYQKKVPRFLPKFDLF